MNRQLTLFSTLVFALGMIFGGCTKEEPSPTPDVKPQTQKVAPKADMAGKQVAPQETPPPPPKYVYDPSGRRDPFIPLVATTKRSASSPQEGAEMVPLEPLQKFDLEQLRLIGIVMVKPQPIAMVAAPDGKSYILKKGVKLGRNNGSVIAITIESVVVQEQYIDISGDVRTATVEIKLPKKEGV